MKKYLIIALNLLSRSPIGGKFFKTFLAAAAVGDGSRAIERKDYEVAYKILRRFENDQIDDVWVASCQHLLGTLYLNGRGVEKSKEKAISLFQLAASAGNSEAIRYMRRWNAETRALKSDKSQ